MPQCTVILKHSIRDTTRHQCHFCLALCSVFVVVLSTLVVNTVIDQGPIVFLSLAQPVSGEIDCVYNPIGLSFGNSNAYWEDRRSFNYTQAIETFEQ